MAAKETIVTVVDPDVANTIQLVDQSTLVTVESEDSIIIVGEQELSVTIEEEVLLVGLQETSTTVNVVTEKISSPTTELSTTVVVEEQDVTVVGVAVQGPPGPPAIANHNFVFTLEAPMLANEVSPGVIRVPLPVGESLVGASNITGYVDGRLSPQDRGWRPSSDLQAIEIYIPTNPQDRNIYLDAELEFNILWAK